MGYNKIKSEKKSTKTKQNKTYWPDLGRVSLLKGDDNV